MLVRCNVKEGVKGGVSAPRSTHTGGIDPQAASASEAQRSLHTGALIPWESQVGVGSHIGGPRVDARDLLKECRRKMLGVREVQPEGGPESTDELDRHLLPLCVQRRVPRATHILCGSGERRELT